MKIAIVTEKPSVSRDFAKALNCKQITSNENRHYENSNYIILNSLGHLLKLKEPKDYDSKWERWSPILMVPKKFEKDPLEDKLIILDHLKTQLLRSDISLIINACDAGREGEGIFREIIEYVFKDNTPPPIKRFWTSDVLSQDVISQNLQIAKDQKEFDGLYNACRGREYGDWIVGVNATRAFSVLLSSSKKELISIGRVQTPVLALIAKREDEIEKFNQKNFYNLSAKYNEFIFKAVFDLADAKDKFVFFDLDKLKKIQKDINHTNFKVIDINSKEKNEYAKSLFSMPQLQSFCNEKYSFAPEYTLELAQSLYEKRFQTYPRTDSQYLGSNLKDDQKIDKILVASKKHISNYDKKMAKKLLVNEVDTRVFNDEKLTDHHAIIPSDLKYTKCEYDNLTNDEKIVFNSVLDRFVNVFLPPLKEEEITITLQNGEFIFEAKGKNTIDLGWSEFEDGAKKYSNLDLKLDQYLTLDTSIDSFTTTSPKRFTPGEIIKAMTNASRYANEEFKEILKESDGVGTSATRDKFLPLLEKRSYIEIKNNRIFPLQKGRDLIKIINNQKICDFAFTAILERELKNLEDEPDKFTLDDFLKKCILQADELISFGKSLESKIEIKIEKTPVYEKNMIVGKCPKCANDVIDKTTLYGCSNYINGCDFAIWIDSLSNFGHNKILKTEIKKILKNKTELKFKTKNKTEILREVSLEEINGKYRISIDFDATKKASVGNCPVCNSEIVENLYNFCCSNSNECRFKIYKDALNRFGGKKFTLSDGKKLLSKGFLEVVLEEKNGKKYKTVTTLDEEYGVRIDFSKKVYL